MIAEGAWAAGCFLSGVLAGGATPLPPDRLYPANALTNVYRTGDDRWLLLVFANEDKEFPLFLQAIGHPEAATDPRFKDAASRLANRDEIVALLDAEFAKRPLRDWRELFASANLTAGVAQTFDEVASDPQFIANHILVPIDDGSGQSRLTIDSPVHLDQEPKVAPRHAPRDRRAHRPDSRRARLRTGRLSRRCVPLARSRAQVRKDRPPEPLVSPQQGSNCACGAIATDSRDGSA